MFCLRLIYISIGLSGLACAAEPTRLFIFTGQSNCLGTTADRDDPEAQRLPAGVEDAPLFWSNRSTRNGDGPSALIGDSDGTFLPLQVQQGESNAPVSGAPWNYEPSFQKRLLSRLIVDWRAQFGQRAVPFLQVQLPSLNRDWPAYRDMQRQVSEELDHFGLAITIDTGHPSNVHPVDKRPVGERLARLALADVYRSPGLTRGGPIARAASRNGALVSVTFSDRGTGLKARGDSLLRGFEMAGNNRVFHPADASIVGSLVQVKSTAISSPRWIRYAWAPIPDGTLVNRESLPASPFELEIPE